MHIPIIKLFGRTALKYGIQKTSKNIVRKGSKKIAGETIVAVAKDWKSIQTPGQLAKIVLDELKDATLETIEKTKECAYYLAAFVDDANKYLNESSAPLEIIACWSVISPLGAEVDRALYNAITGEQAKAIAGEAAQSAQGVGLAAVKKLQLAGSYFWKP